MSYKKGHKSGMLGKHHTEETKKRLSNSLSGNKNHFYGKHHTEETKRKIGSINSIKMMGNKYGCKNKGKKYSEEHCRKISEWNKGKHKRYGSDNYNWKGGINTINNKIRTSIEFRLWHESVFARDNWTCQKTGIKGGEIQSHHIQNFADFPELRFAIDNGITFSKETHKEFHHIYGKRNNTREQLEEFLKKCHV